MNIQISPQMANALEMFIILAVELSVLFLAISYLVGMLQRHIPAEKIEAALSSNKTRSYFLAAALGAITPFCSCSTIPMLKGLVRARAGFGPMMVFLFSSPLLNPVIVALLAATFGFTLTGIYVLAALFVSLIAGWILQTAGFERHIRDEEKTKNTCASSSCSNTAKEKETTSVSCCNDAKSSDTKPSRYAGLWNEVWKDFVSVLPYLFIGILIGSAIYGFMPEDLLQEYAGSDNPFAIPLAAVIGVPLYIRAEAVIPLASALMAKGVGAGAVLALIIGSAGASLTELILLRAIFKTRLIITFVAVVFSMAIIAGYAAAMFY